MVIYKCEYLYDTGYPVELEENLRKSMAKGRRRWHSNGGRLSMLICIPSLPDA
jgi:hypothetical protein